MESILVAACIVAVPSVVSTLVTFWFRSKWINLHEKRFKLDIELEPQIRQRILDMAAREHLMLLEDERKTERWAAAVAVNPGILKHLGEYDAVAAQKNHEYTVEASERRREIAEANS